MLNFLEGFCVYVIERFFCSETRGPPLNFDIYHTELAPLSPTRVPVFANKRKKKKKKKGKRGKSIAYIHRFRIK